MQERGVVHKIRHLMRWGIRVARDERETLRPRSSKRKPSRLRGSCWTQRMFEGLTETSETAHRPDGNPDAASTWVPRRVPTFT